jgi:hypothetical protein
MCLDAGKEIERERRKCAVSKMKTAHLQQLKRRNQFSVG